MHLSEFDFAFSPDLVAQQPVLPRDRARLLVLDRSTGRIVHRHVHDLPALLEPGDLVVVNDTKVRAARVIGVKQPSGTPVSVLFVRDLGRNIWEIMVKGKCRVGQTILFGPDMRATVVQRDAGGTRITLEDGVSVSRLFQERGEMPLPPYIKRASTTADHGWYQTVFAKEEGAIAAPTAGLHFTPELLAALRRRRIQLATVTLHVGPATFQPVSTERVEDHRMGDERVEINADSADAVTRTKQAGRRVVAVGTTVVRALETAAQASGQVVPMSGSSRLFITPGYSFKAIDGLMTNFHLPRTTLLMLVSAFAGVQPVRRAYEEAVQERYRFYSYGDAMLVL